MSLTKISPDAINEEINIQVSINRLIDNNQNLIFNAGAGAGKTYALVESLKHIINTHGENLKLHNQCVMCITYTNVAMNELKHRLGNTELIKISTIHERLWDIIKNHQEQLLPIHIQEIEMEITKINSDLDPDDKCIKFKALDSEKQQEFITLINTAEIRDLFYKSYNKLSKEFHNNISGLLTGYDNLLKNVSNFKSLVTKIHKKQKLEQCLSKISAGENNNKKIEYNSNFNSDALHRMLISHDTLIKYSLQIIKEYDLLKHIIIHQYPYILIDEYQDTNEQVIKIMSLLSDYTRDNECKLFIGYFGDTAQNIYDEGVGSKISSLVGTIEKVDKPYNRRSTQEIINVINKIRNDNIQQKSIYDNCSGGSIEFYHGTESNIDQFINYFKGKWQINANNKLHCLVLTNKLVAQYNKFPRIYETISKTAYYKQYYKAINTELLSSELSKLGEIPLLLYRIVNLKIKLESQETTIFEIIPPNIYKKLSFEDTSKIINELYKTSTKSNLKDFLSDLFNQCNQDGNTTLKETIKTHITFEGFDFTFEGLISNLLVKLFQDESDDEKANTLINDLLNVDFIEYRNWYNFINESSNNEVIYHTYHGTKGEEYDNVIILMENNFGIEKKKFPNFFLNYGKDLQDEKEQMEFTNTKNLLYVACSRAIKNLRILYLDDVSTFQDEVKLIFGEIYEANSLTYI